MIPLFKVAMSDEVGRLVGHILGSGWIGQGLRHEVARCE